MTRILLLSLVACSGRGPKDAATFATQFSEAYSARLAQCLVIPGDIVASIALPTDYATRIDNSVEKERTKYDGSAAQDCLDAIPTMDCDKLAEARFMKTEACARAIGGQQKVGAECYEVEFDECAPGSFCNASFDCSGTCQKLGTLGSACSNTELCDFGFQCVRGLCRSLSAEGQPCGGPEAVACDSKLYCDTLTTAAGTCRAQQTSGDCMTQGQCATGTQCVAANDELTAGVCIVPHAEGEACKVGRLECAPFLSCKRNGAGDVNGTCVRWGSIGAPCNIVAGEGETFGCLGSQCPFGLVTATCSALLQSGDPCSFNSECESNLCADNFCLAACALN